MLELSHLALVGALTAIGFVLHRRYVRDPREPPVVGSMIPVLGHIFGLMRFGVGYFAQLTCVPFFKIFPPTNEFSLTKYPAKNNPTQSSQSTSSS
jgi:hypothetical protein